MFNPFILGQAGIPEVSLGAWGTVMVVLVGLVFSAQALTNLLIRWGVLKDKSQIRDASELFATKQELARLELSIQQTNQEIKRLERETEEGRRRLYDEIRSVVSGMNEIVGSLRESVGELRGSLNKKP